MGKSILYSCVMYGSYCLRMGVFLVAYTGTLFSSGAHLYLDLRLLCYID
jgi:hypothetical protein